ncbi:MAG: hypothetical protein ACF8PN_17490 [Phycisphaerales bacterium]
MIALLAAIAFLFITFNAAGQSNGWFTGLGDLPGGETVSVATAVSADGSVIVGSSSSFASVDNPPPPGSMFSDPFLGYEAFRWTREEGMVGLGDLPGDEYFHSFAEDVSADGMTVVGGSWSELSMQGMVPGSEGFRWRPGEGMRGIGVIPSIIQQHSPAYGVTANGEALTGMVAYHDGWYQPFVWTEALGFVELGNLGGPVRFGRGLAVALGGRVVVGSDNLRVKANQNLTVPTTMAIGGEPRPIELNSGAARDVTRDGRMIVGLVGSGDFARAVAWMDGRRIDLAVPSIEGFESSRALAVSSGTGHIVGTVRIAGESHAAIWSPGGACEVLTNALDRRRLDGSLKGWSLIEATDISDDGTTIVGTGLNPAGDLEAWGAWLVDAPRERVLK